MHRLLLALLAALPLTAQSIDLDVRRPAPGWQVVATDLEGEARLSGDLIGKSIPVQVIRGGQLHEVGVTVGERTQAAPTAGGWEGHGPRGRRWGRP